MKKIMLLLITSIFLLIFSCEKEYSCEGDCGGLDSFIIPTIKHPIKIPRDSTDTTGCQDCLPQDTTLNELMVWYSWYNVDNSKVKKQYFCVRTKYIPGHFQIVDSIPVQSSISSYYNGWLNIKSYRDQPGVPNNGRIFYEDQFQKGDKFDYFFQMRYRDGTILMTDTITLIY